MRLRSRNKIGTNADLACLTSSVGVGIALGLAALTALFNIIEMILFAVKKLSPVTVVVFNSINTAIWTAMLMLLIIASIVRNSIGDWILVIILL